MDVEIIPMMRTCLIAVFVLARVAFSADYFVSPSGSDSNDGKSAEKPWKTVAKVSSTAFQPGDQVFFQRGGEWREALSASSNGTAEKPIVYDAYGKGAKPKFWGSEVLPNAGWQPLGSNVYAYNGLVAAPFSVLADHGVAPKGQWFWNATAKPLAVPQGTFEYSNGQLRITSQSDPKTDGRVYTAVLRQDLINSNGKSHLVFRNIQVDESADPNNGYGVRVMGSANVTVEDVDAYRAGRHHFGTINSTGFVGRRLHAEYAMPQNDSATFYVSFSDASRSLDTSTWIDCSGEHFENPGRRNHQIMYNHGPGLGALVIQNMTSKGGMFSVGQETPANVITIKGGHVHDAPLEIFGKNITVDGMLITGEKGCIDCFGSENIFQNCKLTGICPINGGPTCFNSAILFRDQARGNTVRFCTVVIDKGAGEGTTCLTFGGKGLKTKWYGNIFVSNKKAVSFFYGTMDATDAEATDYNLYNANATFGDIPFAQWKALGADGHSLAAEPKFNADGAYTLQNSSPAVNAAKMDATLLPPADFAGKKRAAGTADIGACECF